MAQDSQARATVNPSKPTIPDPAKITGLASDLKPTVSVTQDRVRITLPRRAPTSGTEGERFIAVFAALSRELEKSGAALNDRKKVWTFLIPLDCSVHRCETTQILPLLLGIGTAHAQILDRNIVITVDPSRSEMDRLQSGFVDYFKGAYSGENALATFLNNMGFVLKGMGFRYVVEAIASGITKQAGKRLFGAALATLVLLKLAQKSMQWADLYNQGRYEELGADLAQFTEAALFFLLGSWTMREFIRAATRRGYAPATNLTPRPPSGNPPSGGGAPRPGYAPSNSPRVANAPRVSPRVRRPVEAGGATIVTRSISGSNTATLVAEPITAPVALNTAATAATRASTAPLPDLNFVINAAGVAVVETDSVVDVPAYASKSIALGLDVSRLHFHDEFYTQAFAATGELLHPQQGKLKVRIIPMGRDAWAMKEYAAYLFSQRIKSDRRIRLVFVPETDLATIDGHWVAIQRDVGREAEPAEIEGKLWSILPQNTVAALDDALGAKAARTQSDVLVAKGTDGKPFYFLRNNGWMPGKGEPTPPSWPSGTRDHPAYLAAKSHADKMKMPAATAKPAAWAEWGENQITEHLRYFGDLTEDELAEATRRLKEIDEEIRKNTRSSSGSKTDEQYLREVLEEKRWSEEHRAALERLRERCRSVDKDERPEEALCNVVEKVLEFFDREEREQADAMDFIKALLAGFEWLEGDANLLVFALQHFTADVLSNLEKLKSDRGNLALREAFISVLETFIGRVSDDASSAPLREGVRRLIARLHDRRRYDFFSSNQALVENLNQYIRGKRGKKIQSGFRDVGSDIEIHTIAMVPHLQMSSGYANLFDAVREVIIQAKNEAHRRSIRSMVKADFSIGSAGANQHDWLEEVKQVLQAKRWEDLGTAERERFLKGLLYNYFENRPEGMNDWMPVFQMRPRTTARKEGIFLGKTYRVGDEVDLGKIWGDQDAFFASHDKDDIRVEVKFRLGQAQRLSSGDVEAELKQLLEILGIEKDQYWMHIHNVVPVPRSFAKLVGKLRLFDYYGRVDASTQFASIATADGWVDFAGGFAAQITAGTRDALQNVMRSPSNRLNMDPLQFYRTFSYVSLVGSDRFETDPDGRYLLAFENRLISAGVNSTNLNNGIQYSLMNEDYGVSEDAFARWLAAEGYDLNALDFDALAQNLNYLNFSGTRDNGSIRGAYARAPEAVKALLARYGIGDAERFQQRFLRLVNPGANGLPLFYNFARTPLAYQYPGAIPCIEAAQLYYLERILQLPPGATPAHGQVIFAQFINSGAFQIYLHSSMNQP